MNTAKRFWLIWAAVYFTAGITFLYLFGPPGLSKEYQEKYLAEHNRFKTIVKSEPFKRFDELRTQIGVKYPSQEALLDELYAENPAFTPAKEELAEGIEFVEHYEARPEFHEEETRREWFNILFDWLNSGAVVAIILGFAPKPLGAMLDKQIKAVRERFDESRQARHTAAQAHKEAKQRMAGIEQEKEALRQEGEQSWAAIKMQIDHETQFELAQLDRECEIHKREELHRATLALRDELVREAMAQFAERYAQRRTPQGEAAQVDRFIQDLERAS